MLETAIEFLRKGRVVAFPTETVFGLGASIWSEDAVQRIFTLKGRPQDNPLIAHVGCLDQVDLIAQELPQDFYRLAEVFFPGPLTILVTKKEGISVRVTAGLSTIGVRMPAHPIAKALCIGLGHPIVAPSANLSGRPSATRKEHVIADFGTELFVLDGECGIGLESTIVVLGPTPSVVRPGAITAEQIGEVLGRPVGYLIGNPDKPICPGMKYRHYAPQAEVVFVPSVSYVLPGERVIIPSQKTLYAELRQADADRIQRIYLLDTLEVRSNIALMNRIEKIVSKV